MGSRRDGEEALDWFVTPSQTSVWPSLSKASRDIRHQSLLAHGGGGGWERRLL
jgi:hypothetical protein